MVKNLARTVIISVVGHWSSDRDDLVVRGAILFLIVQGAALLLMEKIAPQGVAGVLTKISVLPLASIVAIGAVMTFFSLGGMTMINQIARYGDWSVAGGYTIADAYLAVARWVLNIADGRAG